MKYRSELLYEYAKEHIRDQDVPPILVPSYNRPDAKLLQRLLVEPELPVILCVRREQEELYSRWKDKCAFLLLDNVHDIAETRAEIVRQVSPYLNQAFMFDDDINELDYLIPSLTRNGVESMRTSKLNTGYVARYIDILKMWLCLIEQADSKLTLSSLLYRPDSWHLKNKNAPTEYNNGACIQCVHLNIKNLNNHQIQYKPHALVGNEDYALQFDIMSRGLLTTVFKDLMYGCPAVNSHPGGCENANGYSDAHERYRWYVSCAKQYYKDHPGVRYITTKRTGIESVKFNWKYWRKE
jgi:hypothetical protein